MTENEQGEISTRQRVVDLALKHQIISPYTSLVAVEKQVARPSGEGLKGGMMPVNLPAGWHGEAVFGRLPQTASSAPLLLLIGGLSLLLWAIIGWRNFLQRPLSGLFR